MDALAIHPLPVRTHLLRVLLVLVVVALGGCGGGSGPAEPSVEPGEQLGAAAELGRLLFHDASLSASKRLSCASCHDPARGHASPFVTAVAFGGPDMDRAGLRTAPSIRYLRFNTFFRFDAGGEPAGGFFSDGRAASLQEQAREPLLDPDEMANRDVAEVVARVAAAPYAAQFEKVFGPGILAQPDLAMNRIGYALARYQQEDPDFAPFTSKYDAVLAGRATLTAQEANGLDLFNRPDKGNCASCHSSTRPANAPGPLFTDFTYAVVAAPRNPAIPANADPAFYDEGLCGPVRTDLADRTELCGAFRVPSLRNVALRAHFFHNGVFTSLEQAVRFSVQRDTDAQLWYPMDAQGQVIAYDDLPAALRGNVTRQPPYDRAPGQPPALTDSEFADVVAFLRTLTDGYAP